MNFFSDPELRARQDVLNAQWNGLWGTYNATCENGLGNAFPEFATDYNGWRDFYASGQDWNSASKHATDEWQTKAQEWSKRLRDYGCGDTSRADLGIPGVKDNPEDRAGLIGQLGEAAKVPFDFLANLAWGVLVIIALVIAGIFWVVHSKNVKAGNVAVSS